MSDIIEGMRKAKKLLGLNSSQMSSAIGCEVGYFSMIDRDRIKQPGEKVILAVNKLLASKKISFSIPIPNNKYRCKREHDEFDIAYNTRETRCLKCNRIFTTRIDSDGRSISHLCGGCKSVNGKIGER